MEILCTTVGVPGFSCSCLERTAGARHIVAVVTRLQRAFEDSPLLQQFPHRRITINWTIVAVAPALHVVNFYMFCGLLANLVLCHVNHIRLWWWWWWFCDAIYCYESTTHLLYKMATATTVSDHRGDPRFRGKTWSFCGAISLCILMSKAFIWDLVLFCLLLMQRY